MTKRVKFLRELKKLDPKNQVKTDIRISKVLENFIKPYLHLTSDLTSKQKLLTLAVIAWNASLYPESERGHITDLLFSEEVIGDDPNIAEELTEIIEEFIRRKQSEFNDYQYLIVDFELQQNGTLYHLTVTSQKFQPEFHL